MGKGILLGTKTLVGSIRHSIRELGDVFIMSHLPFAISFKVTPWKNANLDLKNCLWIFRKRMKLRSLLWQQWRIKMAENCLKLTATDHTYVHSYGRFLFIFRYISQLPNALKVHITSVGTLYVCNLWILLRKIVIYLVGRKCRLHVFFRC